MKRVIGIGGIFFKCNDVEKLKTWYGQHLGLPIGDYGANFESRQAEDPAKKETTVWSPFKASTTYFEPSPKQFMINYRVENIEWVVEQLKNEGVTILDEIQSFDYGKFVHILDPEDNKIELWEPNDIGSEQ